MTCKNCGATLPENSAFCTNCGNMIQQEEAADDRTVFLPDYSVYRQTELDSRASSAKGSSSLADAEEFFGLYKVSGIIGEGGGGIVYKAVHIRLNKEVVIKQIINPNGSLSRNETDLLKGLKHTYLPQVLDFIEKDGQCYTVMDFIAGLDIEKTVQSGKKFSVNEIMHTAVQLCQAVSYLHSFDPPIVHSDIKPANVMLQPNGDICLIDFNVSLIFDKNAKTIGGSLGYAPPEQLGIPLSDIGRNGIDGILTIGKEPLRVDERSDVYSIGALLYFMITGEKPDVNYNRKPVTDHRKDIPDDLLHVITTAMALDPAKRYKNAKEMLSAINDIEKSDKNNSHSTITESAVNDQSVRETNRNPVIAAEETDYISPTHTKQKASKGGFSSKKTVIIIIAAAVLIAGGVTAAVSTGGFDFGGTRTALQLADKYLSEHNYEQAVIEFQKALEANRVNIGAYLGLADAYIALGENDKAKETLEKGIEQTDSDKLRDRLKELGDSLKPVTSAAETESAAAAVSETEPLVTDPPVEESSVTVLGVEYDIESTVFLDIRDQSIDDEVFEEMVPNLKKLTNLKYLWLLNTKITDISSLAQLTDLTELYLQNSKITDITPIAELTNLTSLSLSNNRIDDIAPLAQLTNLTQLYLQSSQVTDLSHLVQLTDLTYLSLNNNEITDITPLIKLTNLTELYLYDTLVSEQDIEYLKYKLPNCKIYY